MQTSSWKSYRLLATAALCLTLSACDQGKAPHKTLEVAVQGIYSANISSDGSHAIIGSIQHGGSLWDLNRSERLYNWNHKEGEYSQLTSSAFSPSTKHAITADYQNLVLWNIESGSASRFWTSPDEMLSVALSTEGRFALLGLANYTAVMFDVQQGGVRRVFQHDNRVRSVSLSADGKLALSGSEDGSAKLWNTDTGELLQTIQHDGEVNLVSLAPNGDLALSVSQYDKAVVWRTKDGGIVGELDVREFAIQRGLTYQAAAFSEDSRSLLTGTSDRVVQLWDTSSLKRRDTWTVPKRSLWKPTSAAILALGFQSTDNSYWAIASNGLAHNLRK